jgi:hypothetical protein
MTKINWNSAINRRHSTPNPAALSQQNKWSNEMIDKNENYSQARAELIGGVEP